MRCVTTRSFNVLLDYLKGMMKKIEIDLIYKNIILMNLSHGLSARSENLNNYLRLGKF